MTVVRMVQVAIHQVIDVVSMGHGIVPAIRSVLMRPVVRLAPVRRSAGGRVRSVHFDGVLVEMISMRAVQVPVVQVIHMVPVPDCGVTAPLAVDMAVSFVNRMPHCLKCHFECTRKSLPPGSGQKLGPERRNLEVPNLRGYPRNAEDL